MSNSLNCIVCDCELEDAGKNLDNQPYKGTTFTSHGQYGSTVFDNMNGNGFLEINVCDECLRKKARTHVLLGRPEVKRTVKYMEWLGEVS